MTEKEYVLLRNCSALEHARTLIQTILPGKEYKIPEEKYIELVEILAQLIKAARSKIKIK